MAIRRKRTLTRPSADIPFFPAPDAPEQYMEKTQLMFKKALDMGILLAPDVGWYSADFLSQSQFRIYRDEAAIAEMDDLIAQNNRGFPTPVDSDVYFETNNIIVTDILESDYTLPDTF